jgi:hypothetical protein
MSTKVKYSHVIRTKQLAKDLRNELSHETLMNLMVWLDSMPDPYNDLMDCLPKKIREDVVNY